jgi:hypothetical protein
MATLEQAIQKYISLRDEKEAIQRKHKDELATINEGMKLIEKWTSRELNKMGLEESRSSVGSVFFSNADTCKVVDKDAFLSFCKDTNQFELMEIKASKVVVRDFMTNSGEIPAGVEFKSADVVRFRRKS